MRIVAFDVGLRRTGVAVSDPSGTLARPWRTIEGRRLEAAVALVRQMLTEEDGLEAVVIGWPRHLDGRPTELTPHAQRLAEAIRAHVTVPVVLQDERLSSREAESRLAVREKDWRRRKARLDAASAAVILQDYLDRRRAASGAGAGPPR